MTACILGIVILLINLLLSFTLKSTYPDYFSYSLATLILLGLPLILRYQYIMNTQLNEIIEQDNETKN